MATYDDLLQQILNEKKELDKMISLYNTIFREDEMDEIAFISIGLLDEYIDQSTLFEAFDVQPIKKFKDGQKLLTYIINNTKFNDVISFLSHLSQKIQQKSKNLEFLKSQYRLYDPTYY